MTDETLQRYQRAMENLTEHLAKRPGFLQDEDACAVMTILMTVATAIRHDEVHSLATLCADWCRDTARASERGKAEIN